MATKTEAKPAKAVGKGVDEFRSLYDKSYIVPRKIRSAFEKLGDGWLREAEFAKLAEVNTNDLSAFRAEFEDHIVALAGTERGKRAWAGTKRMASKLREMLS